MIHRPAFQASMMLLTFSRGSRQRNTNRASGNSCRKNGTRSAFFGVFSSQRRPARGAIGLLCESTMRLVSMRSISAAIGAVA